MRESIARLATGSYPHDTDTEPSDSDAEAITRHRREILAGPDDRPYQKCTRPSCERPFNPLSHYIKVDDPAIHVSTCLQCRFKTSSSLVTVDSKAQLWLSRLKQQALSNEPVVVQVGSNTFVDKLTEPEYEDGA